MYYSVLWLQFSWPSGHCTPLYTITLWHTLLYFIESNLPEQGLRVVSLMNFIGVHLCTPSYTGVLRCTLLNPTDMSDG